MRFGTAIARAAGTSVDRVAVHTLHQHDAPGCDFEANELLASRGLAGAMFPRRLRSRDDRPRGPKR